MKANRILSAFCGLAVAASAGRADSSGFAWTSLNYPGASQTQFIAVDGNNIVGGYQDTHSRWHGLLYDGTTWTTLDYPGATAVGARGILGNKIVGLYVDANNVSHGFLYDSGTWTSLDYPGATSTYAWGIDGNNIVGQYQVNGDTTHPHGFSYDGTTWTTLDYPGASSTQAYGIDGSSIAGAYNLNGHTYGFLLNGTTWSSIQFPGASDTWVYGIEGTNRVGTYKSGGYNHGFLYSGTLSTMLQYPGSSDTYAYGISGNKIVGYSGSLGWWRGFVLTITHPLLSVTVTNPSWGTVDIEPNLPFYLDPNTVVTLTGRPIIGRAFDRWTLYDPNNPGDANFAAYDANAVIRVRMNTDRQLDATFKCDSQVAPSWPWATLDYPGSTDTVASAVSGDTIVGTYHDGNSVQHGFLYSYSGNTWTTLDNPGGTNTSPTGVSGGKVVGTFVDSNSVTCMFLYDGQTWTQLVEPGYPGIFNQIGGIDGNDVVGTYQVPDFISPITRGFLYDGAAWTTLGTWSTQHSKYDYNRYYVYINDVSSRRFVGTYQHTRILPPYVDENYGLFYDGTTWTTVNGPDGENTYFQSIDSINVVGRYTDSSSRSHGLLCAGTTWTTLDHPNGTETIAYGIDGNKIVGAYKDTFGRTHAFLVTMEHVGTFILTVAPSPVGHGMIIVDPPPSTNGKYVEGTVVTLTAEPNQYRLFSHWEGDVPGGYSTLNPVTLTMDGNKQVTAVFTWPNYTLTLGMCNAAGGAQVNVEPFFPNQIYPSGTSVTLNAIPAPGKGFDHWEILDPNHPDDGNYMLAVDANNPITIVMDTDRLVTAVFRCSSGTGPMLPLMMLAFGGLASLRRRR